LEITANKYSAWIGDFPEHWEVLRIKNLFQEMDSRSETGSEELLSVSHYTGVTLKRESLENEDDHLTNAASLVGYKLVQQGDLVINIMLAWNGSLGISPHNGMTSPAYCVYRIKGNNNPEYFGYLFTTNLFKAEFRRHSTGIIDSRLRLYSDKFFSIFTVVPPKDEQDEIVQYIRGLEEKINLFIQKKQRFIELLKEQRQGVIESAITYKVGWTKSRIKNIAKMFGRIGFRGYQTSDLVDEGEGAITISPSNMKHHKQMDFSNCSYLSWEKYEESPEIKIFERDIIMVKTGASYGKVAQVLGLPEKATINPQLMVFKEIFIDNDYFFYFLQSGLIKEQMEKNVIGGTIPTISQTKIGSFRLHYPNIEEQKQIVSNIKTETVTIDTAIAKAEREIELIREYKEAMIAESVMGKRKVQTNFDK
jgi:type I restriction enzyme S subunit